MASRLDDPIVTLDELPYTVLRDAIFTHPTAAEGLTGLLADVATESISGQMLPIDNDMQKAS